MVGNTAIGWEMANEKIVASYLERQSEVYELRKKYHIIQSQLAFGNILSYGKISTVIPGIVHWNKFR